MHICSPDEACCSDGHGPGDAPALTDAEFARFRRFIHEAAGISIPASKKALVCGRLWRRVQQLGLPSYGQYLQQVQGADAAERQVAIDLLTTNETYFFREERHFDVLRQRAAARRAQPLRAWSAACSSGEEPYSMAMVLADVLGDGPGAPAWQVLGTDISSRMLRRARAGHYALERARLLPAPYLKRFCLKGVGPQAGTLLVQRGLRQRVGFQQANLNDALPALGRFDVVFLRNVMIYFDLETKRRVVDRVVAQIEPGGLLCIGHAETLQDVPAGLEQLAPSVYRKPQ